MAIIRPLEGPAGERPANGRRDDGRVESSEPATSVFRVPESVWDVDTILHADRPPAPEQHDLDAVEAAIRWRHPSMWGPVAVPPPLSVVRHEDPTPPAEESDEEPWLAAVAEAAARARTLDTPDAWRALASAADLVSEMARALELVADAVLNAADHHRAARDAARLAHDAEETARAAARRADDASRWARELDGAVAVARHANSPESWGEVRRLAMDRWAGQGSRATPGTAPHIGA